MLRVGYRHVDTATLHANEEEVGRALADRLTVIRKSARPERIESTWICSGSHSHPRKSRAWTSSHRAPSAWSADSTVTPIGINVYDPCILRLS